MVCVKTFFKNAIFFGLFRLIFFLINRRRYFKKIGKKHWDLSVCVKMQVFLRNFFCIFDFFHFFFSKSEKYLYSFLKKPAFLHPLHFVGTFLKIILQFSLELHFFCTFFFCVFCASFLAQDSCARFLANFFQKLKVYFLHETIKR